MTPRRNTRSHRIQGHVESRGSRRNPGVRRGHVETRGHVKTRGCVETGGHIEIRGHVETQGQVEKREPRQNMRATKKLLKCERKLPQCQCNALIKASFLGVVGQN